MVLNSASYSWTGYGLPTALVSTVIFAIGLFVFAQRPKGQPNIFFFLLCLAINCWLYGISVVYSANHPEVALAWYRGLAFLGVVYIAPLVYIFSVHWLNLYKSQKGFVTLALYLAPAFYIISLITPWGMPEMQKFYWGYFPKYGPVGKLFMVFFFTYFLAAFYNFFSMLKNEQDALKRKQIRWIAVAFLIAVTGSVDYVPKLYSVALYPFGYLPVFTWILIVAYLIVRYRVMDIQTVIHKTILWAVVSFTFAFPLIPVAYVVRKWLFNLHPILFGLAVIAFTALLVLYGRWIQPKIDHFFHRRQWDLNQVFEKFTDELIHLRDLESLSAHIAQTVREVFYVDRLSLLLFQERANLFQSVTSYPPSLKFNFESAHPFLVWMSKNNVLVVRQYLDMDPRYEKVKDDARAYFNIVQAELCVPFVLDEKLLGVMNIGRKVNLKGFGTAEISFLADLRKTAAIALSNSMRSIAMQENLRSWNVELEKKVDERTRELKETQSQLVQAEKLASLGTLAGGIAHEINNPLTAVLTNVQMIRMLNQIDVESLSLIEQGAKRCQGIIQKLMRYARKTEEVDNFERIDLNKVIRSVIDFLGYQIQQENVQLNFEPGNIGSIEAIANELEQVFTNLLINAMDAIRPTGRRGIIEIKSFEQNGYVQVEVSDNGMGIRKENLSKIFDPFYTTKDVGQGTGLGLTVTSGIIEKHRGQIFVRSQESAGSTFTLRFPRSGEKLAVSSLKGMSTAV